MTRLQLTASHEADAARQDSAAKTWVLRYWPILAVLLGILGGAITINARVSAVETKLSSHEAAQHETVSDLKKAVDEIRGDVKALLKQGCK